MFVMVDVRGTGLGAEDFAWRLLEAKGVAVLAADTFGPSATGHVRITFAVADAKLAEACERIAAFAQQRGQFLNYKFSGSDPHSAVGFKIHHSRPDPNFLFDTIQIILGWTPSC